MAQSYSEKEIKEFSSREGDYYVRACEKGGRSIVEHFEEAYKNLLSLSLEGRVRMDQVQDFVSELTRAHPAVSFYIAYKFQVSLIQSQFECQNAPHIWREYVENISNLKKPVDLRGYSYLVTAFNEILGDVAQGTLKRAAVEYSRPEFTNVKQQTPESIIQATERVCCIHGATLDRANVKDLKKNIKLRRPKVG